MTRPAIHTCNLCKARWKLPLHRCGRWTEIPELVAQKLYESIWISGFLFFRLYASFVSRHLLWERKQQRSRLSLAQPSHIRGEARGEGLLAGFRERGRGVKPGEKASNGPISAARASVITFRSSRR